MSKITENKKDTIILNMLQERDQAQTYIQVLEDFIDNKIKINVEKVAYLISQDRPTTPEQDWIIAEKICGRVKICV